MGPGDIFFPFFFKGTQTKLWHTVRVRRRRRRRALQFSSRARGGSPPPPLSIRLQGGFVVPSAGLPLSCSCRRCHSCSKIHSQKLTRLVLSAAETTRPLVAAAGGGGGGEFGIKRRDDRLAGKTGRPLPDHHLCREAATPPAGGTRKQKTKRRRCTHRRSGYLEHR